MTKENLLRYLRDPEYLHQISYQELKTLVAEHPNSYTLRHILAVKSRQEGNNDYLSQKEFAALYSIDRPHLFDVLTKAEILEALPDGVLLQEDYLELKELSALEKELSMVSIAGSAAASTAVAAAVIADIPKVPPSKTPLPAIEFEEDENSEEFFILDFEEETSVENLEIEEVVKPGKIQGNLAEIEALFEDVDNEDTSELYQIEEPLHTVSIESITDKDIADDTLANAAFIEIPLDVITTEEDEPVEIENTKETKEVVASINPIPKSKFSTWRTPKSEFSGFDLIGLNSKGMIDELAIKTTKRRVTETTIVTPVINRVAGQADDHLEFESDIASETLAKILIIQGHYTKAIVMYQRLSLIFPEKSGLFAAEIKKIENLEDRSTL